MRNGSGNDRWTRIAVAAVVLSFVVVGVAGWHTRSAGAEESAAAIASGLDAEAEKAVETWVTAVASGEAETVRAVLAPEFQILRSDGTGHGFDGYLAGGMAKIEDVPGVTDLVVTGHDDHMVVRYALTLEGSVDGRHMEDKAPRLTVFRRAGDAWLVVAHANFARLGN